MVEGREFLVDLDGLEPSTSCMPGKSKASNLPLATAKTKGFAAWSIVRIWP